MSLAMIARADQGGLGAQTYEFFRHMRPDKCLIALVGHQTRGVAQVGNYYDLGYDCEIQECYLPTPSLEVWLTRDMDHLWSAETWYSPSLPAIAQARGTTLTLHGNPEMGLEAADRLWLATDWLAHRFPKATVVPFPAAGDVLPYSPVPKGRTFVHVLSKAMEDRNGTEIVLQAAQHLRNPCRLLMMGEIPRTISPVSQVGPVTITWLRHNFGLYYQAWPRADALLLPRRYGGLCLPMQEAFIQGLPCLTLDLEPQRGWVPAPEVLCPARGVMDVRMKGGTFQVFDADPREYARYWDRLIEDDDLVQLLSSLSRAYGQGLDWAWRQDEYERLFDRSPVPA